jgi:hypothetical protein
MNRREAAWPFHDHPASPVNPLDRLTSQAEGGSRLSVALPAIALPS